MFWMLIRRILIITALFQIVAINSINNEQCTISDVSKECKSYFKDYGFKSMKSFTVSANNEVVESISLVAAGMRKKNLFVVEVDVYTVGIYISPLKDTELLTTIANQKNRNQLEISTPLLNDNKDTTVTLGIVLHFVRSVGRKQVVDAIVDALSYSNAEAIYTEALNKFSDILLNSITSNGMSKDDELSFTYYGSSGESLSISLNDKYVGTVNNVELRRKLAEIYCSSEKSITLEVVKVLQKRYQ